MSRVVYALGRVLVSLVFVVAGYRHFMSIGGFAKQLSDRNVPVPMQIEGWTGLPRYEFVAYAGAAIEVLCGVMILIGFKTRFAAAVLIQGPVDHGRPADDCGGRRRQHLVRRALARRLRRVTASAARR